MLIKIGAKIVSHSRHVACQMAGGHVQKQESRGRATGLVAVCENT